MGWNFCIATESDREQAKRLRTVDSADEDYELFNTSINSLSRQFSYALSKRNELLQSFFEEKEAEALNADDIEYPNHWQPRNPQQLLEIFCKVKEQLEQENGQMPVNHFLWYLDEQGNRYNGSTKITLPFQGIELKLPHDPIVKLDGGHHDPEHRWELRMYDVHIDADLLTQFQLEIERKMERYHMENDIEPSDDTLPMAFQGGSAIDPLVEVPVKWIPVQPILEVLGCQIEVQSIDSLAALQPDLDTAIYCCEQAIRLNAPLYWLKE
ncbi:MAG: hypothetical protein ACFB2W_13015 [Leptolyngbyaceae cyanobacterium]